MEYAEAVAWLYGRQSLGIKLGLDKMRALLAAVGNPQDAFPCVHVAGTNGKGSVTTMLAAALQCSGHRVGHTTSPHLVRFAERFQVDGQPCSEADVAAAITTLRPHVESMDPAPTFFEISIAAAFMLFAQRGVDWAVVETGLGGRLDATNVLAPRLAVITNVGLDHQDFLGHDVAAIAHEKAGIMKPGVPCVTGASGAALDVLKATSHTLQSPMSILGEDYHVLPDLNGMRLVTPHGEAHYDVASAGAHQLDNAALVVAAADALRAQGTHVPPAAVHRALRDTVMPGRMELLHVDGRPWGGGELEVLIDGAHNLDGAHALRRHLGHLDWGGFDLIVGANRDKPWRDLLAQWAPLARHVWGVPLRTGRRVVPAELGAAVDAPIPYTAATSFEDALRQAIAGGATRIVCAGSLFLAGEARAVLLGQDLEEVRGDQ